MKALLKSSSIVVVLLALAIPASGHHSISGSYDLKTMFTLKGTVTRIVLRNPHPMLFLDVVNPSTGRTESWMVEAANQNWLALVGAKPDLPELDILRKLNVGMVVTVNGFRSIEPIEHKAAFETLLDIQGKEIGSVPTTR